MIDLKKIYRIHNNEINNAILNVLSSGIYILGDEVKRFEEEFSNYIGTRYGISVASGTEALTIALKALGINPGDNVIIPANAYPTVFALASVDIIPNLVDCDNNFYTIDPIKIEKKINKKTKAIIVVHLYGQACDMDSIMRISKKYSIPIIEDCAQAHGAMYKGIKVGNFGSLSCFSFYPTKNLGAIGDGGMILTNSRSLHSKVKLLRMYGEKERYKSLLPGFNSRLDEIQAAILRIKLKYLDDENKKRRELAKIYIDNLKNIKQLTLPSIGEKNFHVFHLFVIKTKKRNNLKKFLEKNDIYTAIHYPKPIHLQKWYDKIECDRTNLENSENISKEILSLPLYPYLTKKEINIVINKIHEFFK